MSPSTTPKNKQFIVMCSSHPFFSLFSPFKKNYFIFIFYFGSTSRHAGSLIRDQTRAPLQWKCGALTPGLPGKSWSSPFLVIYKHVYLEHYRRILIETSVSFHSLILNSSLDFRESHCWSSGVCPRRPSSVGSLLPGLLLSAVTGKAAFQGCSPAQPLQFSSVQSLSYVWLFVTAWTAARQASLSITNSRSPPKPMSTESVMPPNHLFFCCPFLLLPSIFPSIRVFSNESALSLFRQPLHFLT